MLPFRTASRWCRKSLHTRQLATASRQHDEPLRILFCGSDEFSIASLRALHEYGKEANSNILSIDVAAKQDKLTGRGLKKLKAPLIKSVAHELDLPLHQFNTFTGWIPPEYPTSKIPSINLIVAVSFGLLVPSRIINGATFGGLNVHPSLLPDLRGAAPLNWAIIKGYTQTGVSVQTLHPTKFDEGVVLAQTKPIDIPLDAHTNGLQDLMAPIGADLLVNVLKNKLYLKPHVSATASSIKTINMAPKIVTQTKLLDPVADDIQTILRKNRAVPKLFSYALSGMDESNPIPLRIIFGTEMREATPNEVPSDIVSMMQPGEAFALSKAGVAPSNNPGPIYIICKDGKVLRIPLLLVEGRKECPASQAAAGSRLLQSPRAVGSHSVHSFLGLRR